MWKKLMDSLLAITAVANIALATAVVVLHIGFVRVVSGSMAPKVGVGDVALVRSVPVSELHIGEVVVLPLPDNPSSQYLHRIQDVQTEDGGVVLSTKGDANTSKDHWKLKVTSPQVPVMFAVLPVASVSNFLMANHNRDIILALLFLLALFELARATRHAIQNHHGAPKPPLTPAH